MTNKSKAILYTVYSCLAYLVVMGALFIWKREEYITEKGTGVGVLGFIVVGLVLICFKNKIFKLIEASNVLFTFSLIGFVCCFAIKLMNEELLIIFSFSLCGSAISGVFDKVVKVYKENSFKLVDGIKQPNRAKALSDKEAWARAFGINFKAEGVEDNAEL